MKIKPEYQYRKQLSFIHTDDTRFKVVVAHRRAGKTVASINQLILAAISHPGLIDGRAPRYAYIAPTYKQAKSIVWDYLKQYVEGIKAALHSVSYNESELKVYLRYRPKERDPGNRYCSIIKLWGAENPGSIKGMYLNGCILDEVAQMDRRLWSEAVRPMLIDRKGWCIFIGTPQGKNMFYDLHQRAIDEKEEEWKSWTLKASETRIINKVELMNIRREMSPEEYQQELECNFSASAIIGAYYAKQIQELEDQKRISENIIHDPTKTVYTSWDLGIDDSTAIWFFQIHGDHVKFIDYYESSGMPISHYVDVLRNKSYIYEYAILPHDAAKRDLSTGKAIEDTINSLGIKTSIVPLMPVHTGIEASRILLRKSSFNSETCKVGIDHLAHYRCEYNERLGINRQRPLHDSHSHASDSLRYCALGLPKERNRTMNRPIQMNTGWNAFK